MARPTFGVNLFVQDIDKNVEYFTNILGFKETERTTAPNGATVHASTTWGTGAKSASVSFASIPTMVNSGEGDYDFGAFGTNLKNSPSTLGNGVVLYFNVPNVDKFYAKIVAKGAIIDEPPTEQMWGDRTISVLTPDGFYLTFSQPIKGWKPSPDSGMVTTRAKLSPAQRNQRKYAATVKGIRGRAAKAAGGKGRIKNRPAAKKLRGKLGLEDN